MRNSLNHLEQVKAFVLDMDGTLYLGEQLLAGTPRFLRTLKELGYGYLLLTNNSSQNADYYQKKLQRLGIAVGRKQILTSGEVTAGHVSRTYGDDTRVYVAGTRALKGDFRHAGLTFSDEDPDVIVLGFDTTFTYASLWKLCDLVRQGLPYVATHPDINCPTENGMKPDIGAVIAFVHAATRRLPDAIPGKPNHSMLQAAAARLGLEVGDLACLGDRLYTDIAMGQMAGIPSVLVLSGETRAEDVVGSQWQPDLIVEDVGELADRLIIAHRHHRQ